MKLKFTQTVLDSMLDDIEEVYSEGYTLKDAIQGIKEAYKDEIETLEEGPVWIKDREGGTNEGNNRRRNKRNI